MEKIFTVKMWSSIILEVFKFIITIIYGYIAFKVVQIYKNRSDLNQLYIELVRAEETINYKKNTLLEINNMLIKRGILEERFKEHLKVYSLYTFITELNSIYIAEEPVYSIEGDQIGIEYIYSEDTYYYRGELYNERSYNEDKDDFNFIDSINELENRNLLEDLIKLENRINNIRSMNKYQIDKELEYIEPILKKFNRFDIDKKRKLLHEFCSKMFDGTNMFANTVKDFNDYRTFNLKLKKKIIKPSIEIDIKSLALYNAESFFSIENLINKINRLVIDINNEQQIINYEDDLDDLINEISKVSKSLKKSLSRTHKVLKM